MDDPKHANGAATLGVDAIDRIGVMRISEALGISPQAVRKWRQKGKIPDDRQNDLRQILAALPEQVSALAQVAEVSKAMQVVLRVPRRATGSGAKIGDDDQPTHQALAVVPADPPRLEHIAGRHARASMTLLIAARDVDQAREAVDKAATDADGLPPVLPVWGYKTRLAILFALDFPILTMAFVAVTQVSPIIAAGSAIPKKKGGKPTMRRGQAGKKETDRQDSADGATIDMFPGDKAGPTLGSKPDNGQALGKAVWE